ncbi:MAG: hypothetical protein ACYS22_07980 [Planctomycetota bacterium]
MARPTDEQELSEAAAELDVRAPAEELSRLVRARMETIAKLDGAGEPLQEAVGGGEDEVNAATRRQLGLYPEALQVGLQRIWEATS